MFYFFVVKSVCPDAVTLITRVFDKFTLILYFSRATVSAVLQPCRTCHMLFLLLARCVVCVLGK